MKKVFCMTGASGVGKSTLMKHIHVLYQDIVVQEISARPFLPKNDSYDKTLTDELQTIISQNQFMSILDGILRDHFHVFSRSPIDSLAYQKVLNKARYMDSTLYRGIEITRLHIHYLYIPIEFEMKDVNDIIRGTNKDVQKKTDTEIVKLLKETEVEYTTITGTVQERFTQLTQILPEGEDA